MEDLCNKCKTQWTNEHGSIGIHIYSLQETSFVGFKRQECRNLRVFLGGKSGLKILVRVKGLTFCNSEQQKYVGARSLGTVTDEIGKTSLKGEADCVERTLDNWVIYQRVAALVMGARSTLIKSRERIAKDNLEGRILRVEQRGKQCFAGRQFGFDRVPKLLNNEPFNDKQESNSHQATARKRFFGLDKSGKDGGTRGSSQLRSKVIRNCHQFTKNHHSYKSSSWHRMKKTWLNTG